MFEKTWRSFRLKVPGITSGESKILTRTARQLTEYFKGNRESFDIPYELKGTPFQNQVWSSLKKIPFGKTRTYKEQAMLVKSPKAVRAVGTANGINPLCIILPCHRVIGTNGALTGYAGGLNAKQLLLTIEGAVSQS